MDRIRVYSKNELLNRRRDLRGRSTRSERILWQRLRNFHLGVKFRRQFSISGYVVDFYCPRYKLAIELEGGIHRTKQQRVYDKYREEYLSAFRIRILKFDNEEVENDLDRIIEDICKYFTSRPSPQLRRGEGKG